MLTISVVIPAHNEQHNIGSCLRSVLAQDDMADRYEVIVVNNASTDATADVVQKQFPQVRLINEPRKGLTIAYNRGASEAKGDIVKFVDADNKLPRDHLKKVINEFNNDPKLIAVSGPYVYRDGGRFCELFVRSMYILVGMPLEIVFNRFLNIRSSVASGNLAVRKEAFHKAKGFNEKLFYGLEPDLAARLCKLGKVTFRLGLTVESSARRMKKEGVVATTAKHVLVNIAPDVFSQGFTRRTVDIR
jgi:glycosyltransferase involved in cell wall biosynthesis